MSVEQVLIPDIGEATDVEVVEICVSEGDAIGKDECLIVLESDKASMEVPAPFAGVVNKMGVALGDKVEEGQLIVEIEKADSERADSAVERTVRTPAADEEPGRAAPKSKRKSDANSDANSEVKSEEYEVAVPEVGEAKDVRVAEVLVAPGDSVTAEDPLVVLESDKATMELPAGVAGRVKQVLVSEGDEVFESTVVAVLVLEGDEPLPPRAIETASTQAGPVQREAPVAAAPSTVLEDAETAGAETVYAGPAVRRMARELGVDLTGVSGAAAKGRIVKEDVDAYVRARLAGQVASSVGGIPAMPHVDYARFGPVETVPMSRIMKSGATNLHRSWLNIPHVTQHDEADVTELESFRREQKQAGRDRNVNLTPMPFIMKACCKALAEFPRFNASLSSDGESFVLKKYYHLGMAVDTEDGLVVPVIRDVDRKDIWELAGEVHDVATRARQRKLRLDELAGGSFSVSSLGILGGTGFTPIINAPEVAILGVAKLATRPSWNGKEFVPRQMLPLSLSYDHRANNGAEAARFVSLIARLLGDVRLLLL